MRKHATPHTSSVSLLSGLGLCVVFGPNLFFYAPLTDIDLETRPTSPTSIDVTTLLSGRRLAGALK